MPGTRTTIAGRTKRLSRAYTAALGLFAAATAPAAGDGVGFDYTVSAGESVVFDTLFFTAESDYGVFQSVVNGVFPLDDLTIEAGGQVRVIGPNPLIILATGKVTIDGRLDVSGFPAANVQSLLIAGVPQLGGPGNGGGGDGGRSSPNTTASSAQGEAGHPPLFLAGALGGGPGETGYSANAQIAPQHGGGGGGGVFAAVYDLAPSEAGDGTAAQPGFDGWDSELLEAQGNPFPGEPGAFGALSGAIPPRGGSVGLSPFVDGRPANDFFGIRWLADGRLVVGELPMLLAGFGGGGGGDGLYSSVFPTTDFATFNTPYDRKGGAGGGGGGALWVLADGDVSFGPDGRLLAEGGDGGEAENTPFNQWRPGGGGGAGSGGHVVLETKSRMDFSRANGEAISARGGRGGASTLGVPNPYFDRPVSFGGAGGPGVIQLHVRGGTLAEQLERIALPAAVSLDELVVPRPAIALPTYPSPF